MRYLALLAIPIVLLTLFIPTTKGIRLPLGSFTLLRKFIGKPIKVWSIKDPVFFVLRMLLAVCLALLIFNPVDTTAPNRMSLFHKAKIQDENTVKNSAKIKLVLPSHVVDRFNEDIFFLESFVRSFNKIKTDLTIYYSPTAKQIANIDTDSVIFPALYQDRAFLEKITDSVYFSALESREQKILGRDSHVRVFYPIVIAKNEGTNQYLELEDGTIVAASFKHNGKNVLLWGLSLSSLWGDIGLSGEFIEVIEQFMNGIDTKAIVEESDTFKNTGTVSSVFNNDFLLMAALIAILLEAAFFILRLRAVLIFIILLLPLTSIKAEDMLFIDLSYGDTWYNRAARFEAFNNLKNEIEKRSSIKISQRFYTTIDVKELEKGKLPELPYLFLFGCNKGINVTPELTTAIKNFISRGGIIFSDSCGAEKDIVYNYSIEQLAISLAEGGGTVPDLPQQHPLFRSFYLVSWEHYKGVDVSLTTRRTAFIISRSDILTRLRFHDERSIRSAMNIVLYMLSGNYKSDQLHVRHILKRLQKRELFK